MFIPSESGTNYHNATATSGYGHLVGGYPFEVKKQSLPTTVPSGHTQNSPLILELVDYYGLPYFLENDLLASVSAPLGNISLGGYVKVAPVKGVYNFTDMSVKGAPGLKGKVIFDSLAVDPIKYQLLRGEPLEPTSYEF